MKIFCAFLTILSLLIAPTVCASEPTLSVEELVQLALTNSPSLKAARFTIEEARGRFSDSGRLSNPELEASFAPHFSGGERSFAIGVNQRLPLTARLRLEKRISRIGLASATAEVAEFSRQLAFQVRTTAVTLATIEAQRRLNELQQTNSLEWQNAVRQAASIGEGSELDIAQLELEAGRLLARRAELEKSQSELMSRLWLLTGRDFATGFRVGLQEELKPGRVPLIELRPDVVAAQHRAEAAREGMKLARANRWQDIEVGVFGEIDRNEDAPNGIETDHIAGVRLGIPIPMWTRGTGKIVEAKARSERADAEAAALLIHAEKEVSTASRQLEIAKKHHVMISTDLLPKARKFEERLTTVHTQGQAPFADLLRARERRLELEYSELDALRELHLAGARYMEAVGITGEEQ